MLDGGPDSLRGRGNFGENVKSKITSIMHSLQMGSAGKGVMGVHSAGAV